MVLQGQGADLERDPQGEAAAAAGSRPAERAAPDGARRSAAAAGHASRSSSRAPAATTIRPSKIGLASYTAAMMREGTKTRTTLQMSQELETMAADARRQHRLRRAAERRSSGSALTENFDKLFDIAADVLLNPTFPAEEWDRLKARDEEPAWCSSAPTRRSWPTRRSTGSSIGDHPAGTHLSDTRRGSTPITRDAMVEFHRTRYVPDHAADRVCRRHLAGRGAEDGRGEARRVEEGRRAEAAR